MDDTFYPEEEYLQLSGIQHFLFCRRQWALIHIEQQWKENGFTTDGLLFHSRVHDENETELRGDTLTVRALRIFSRKLGVSGICDAVEFHRAEKGIFLKNYEGLWTVVPIEYKRGGHDILEADAAQLCAEAMCLEEMLCCSIEYGFLFWGEKHRREKVFFDDSLRKKVKESFHEMHRDYQRGYTPKVRSNKGCYTCSLKDTCLPELTRVPSVQSYIRESMSE